MIEPDRDQEQNDDKSKYHVLNQLHTSFDGIVAELRDVFWPLNVNETKNSNAAG